MSAASRAQSGRLPVDVPLGAIPELVPDGSLVAFGGSVVASRPMAAVRELVRARARRLGVVSGSAGLEAELLVAGGNADRLICAYTSLGPFGVAPSIAPAIKEGTVRTTTLSGHVIMTGLDAGGRGVPFLPARTDLNAAWIDEEPDFVRRGRCPWTGEEVVTVRAIQPDVAVLHASEVDPRGNALLALNPFGDPDMAYAASRVVVTYERRVDQPLPASTRLLARTFIDYTVHAPGGAYPTSFAPDHPLAAGWFLDYATDPRLANSLIARLGEAEYLDAMTAQGLR